MAVPPPSPEKQALRAALRARRQAHVVQLIARGGLPAALDAAAERIIAHVPAGASVALYTPFGDELDPAPLAAMLAGRGHALAMPHVAEDRRTMRFLAWNVTDALEIGAYGLRQPRPSSPELAPTVIVTPLVGFDRQGARIGQGAGFYDRAFAALPGAVRIGLAWSVQEEPAIPTDPWDVLLHAIATEREWIVPEATR